MMSKTQRSRECAKDAAHYEQNVLRDKKTLIERERNLMYTAFKTGWKTCENKMKKQGYNIKYEKKEVKWKVDE